MEALRDKIAERVTEANETAVAYVNDATPGIYSLNRNYTAYTIEQISPNADFTLWDEQTVKRLITESPDLMPYYPKKMALKRGIDLEYGKKQITASITSSILQGKSIKHIADDLQERITTMSRASAIRTARTAVTGAQNAGRMDSYKAAEDMGIKLKKCWLATLDGRTRHSHAMLDGQTVDTDKPFKVDGYELMCPGDRSAPGYLVYNCRCTTIAVLPDVDTSDAERWSIDPETGERKLVSDMSYQEWAGWKEKEQKTVANSVQSGIIEIIQTPYKTANQEYNKILDELQDQGVDYVPVKKCTTQRTESEIISTICGGDRTSGSCASVAIAYVGQKHGLDVLDFRGGNSMDYFSMKHTKLNMFKALGATPLEESKYKSDLANGKRILSQMVKGKQYYLSVGRHASIVRLNDDGKAQYLELQSGNAKRSGWQDFDRNIGYTLKWRFGCTSSSSYYNAAYLTDIDQFRDNDELLMLLGFINTKETEQRKGSGGTIK